MASLDAFIGKALGQPIPESDLQIKPFFDSDFSLGPYSIFDFAQITSVHISELQNTPFP